MVASLDSFSPKITLSLTPPLYDVTLDVPSFNVTVPQPFLSDLAFLVSALRLLKHARVAAFHGRPGGRPGGKNGSREWWRYAFRRVVGRRVKSRRKSCWSNFSNVLNVARRYREVRS